MPENISRGITIYAHITKLPSLMGMRNYANMFIRADSSASEWPASGR